MTETQTNAELAYLSRVHYKGTTGSQEFPIPFRYEDKESVKVLINERPLTYITEYTFSHQGLIRLVTPLNEPAQVTIRRDTNLKARAVDFVNAAELTELDLDRSANQVFYAMQEAYDNALDTVKNGADGSLDALGKRLSNLGEPLNPKDAVTKGYSDKQLDRSKTEADRSKTEADRSKTEADRSKTEAAKSKTEADRSKTEAAKSKTEADRAAAAVTEASATTLAAAVKASDRSKTEADRSKTEAERAFSEAERAKTIADIDNVAKAICPYGVPLPYPSDIPPEGWLIMKGQAFDPVLCPILAKLYPSHFLPDMRGKAVVGKKDGEAVLFYEEDHVKSHSHSGAVGGTDLGRKNTNETGQHSHYTTHWRGHYANNTEGSAGSPGFGGTKNWHTNATGAHSHYVDIGAHTHPLVINAFGDEENTIKNIKYNWIVRKA
ncbi:phage tail fiber domain-containing protein [Vibrio sp. SCSIO 43137]|uniref:phage tail fiber domain-containing protein n=1 Tax=Vibrio sp. SCSIO 43137 TaxID=3021011 RepID=UPI0023078488|nr:phage tail fiber protein [Vibrio sp. SCSIO 43137]WCE31252.1 phage tail fiber protein [Vibrio sp. SCSIO 43137]